MLDKQVMIPLNSIREDCIGLSGLRGIAEENVTSLEAPWPQKFLVQPVHGVITFNAAHWENWRQYIETHPAPGKDPPIHLEGYNLSPQMQSFILWELGVYITPDINTGQPGGIRGPLAQMMLCLPYC